MKKGETSLTRVLKAVFEEDAAIRGDESISPEELIALVDGRVPEAARKRIMERLAASPEGVRAVLDLTHFPDIPPSPDFEMTEDDLQAAIQEMQARVRAEEDEGSARRITSISPRFQRWAYAAGIIAVVGLVGWNMLLQSRLSWTEAELRGPRLSRVVELREQQRGSRLDAAFWREDERATMVVRMPYDGLVELRLVDSSGSVLWSSPPFQSRAGGSFVFSFAGGEFKAGEYVVQIRQAGTEGPPQEFPITILPKG